MYSGSSVAVAFAAVVALHEVVPASGFIRKVTRARRLRLAAWETHIPTIPGHTRPYQARTYQARPVHYIILHYITHIHTDTYR